MRKHVISKLCLLIAVLGLSAVPAMAEESQTAEVTKEFVADPIPVGEEIVIKEETPIEYSGTVTKEAKETTFEYTAPRDGRYFIDPVDVKENCSVEFYMSDSMGNTVADGANTMVKLEEDEHYTIKVSYYKGNTNFKVTLREQKPSTDITEYGIISDQIMFSKQKNVYLYTAPKGGNVHFSFQNATANAEYEFLAWDQYGSNIADEYAKNGTGFNVKFESGATYEIQVR